MFHMGNTHQQATRNVQYPSNVAALHMINCSKAALRGVPGRFCKFQRFALFSRMSNWNIRIKSGCQTLRL